MEEPRNIVQLAKINIVFPNIGMEDLVANAVQVLPDVTITVVTSDRYFNDPTSDERLDERDVINGETPELISTKEVDYALSQMIADMRQHISKPGLAILDDNRFPKINIIGAMEAIGAKIDKCNSSGWASSRIQNNTYWDASEIPDKKTLGIPADQHLSDVIRQILAGPMGEPRHTIDVDENENEDGDKSSDCSDQGHRTDNRIGSNTTFRALPFSSSNIMVNFPNSQNRNIARTRAFFSWLFFFTHMVLVIAVIYMIYDIALKHEESATSDMRQKRVVLEDLSE